MATTMRAWRVEQPGPIGTGLLVLSREPVRAPDAGEVVALHAGDAGRIAMGSRVGVAWLHGTCGQCRYCRRGAENLCPQSTYTGWDADGGYADYLTAPMDYIHPLPPGYADIELAPLLRAGIIGYRALSRADLPPGGRLGVYGCGASAHLATRVALARGATVHVLTHGEHARRHATEPLDAADHALADLAAGHVTGAAVLMP